MDIDAHKIITHPLMAGLAGAVIGLKFAPGISWIERVTNVATGASFSAFLAPGAVEMLRLSSASMTGFLAFIIGMFGMSIAAAVFQGLRDMKVGEIVTGWISRK